MNARETILKAAAFGMLAAAFAACGAASKATPPPDEAHAEVSGAKEQEPGPQAGQHAQMAIFVLGRCPYAAEAISTAVDIKKELGGALRLDILYLGRLSPDGSLDRSIGDAEVDAARLNTCVQAVAFEQRFDYYGCVYSGDTWRRLPTGWQECAKKAGVDTEAVDECLASGRPDKELAGHYAATMRAGITASPSIIIGEKAYFGGFSRDEMLAFICYMTGEEKTRPRACLNVEPPPAVEATVLFDSRCEDPGMCDTSRPLKTLAKVYPGLEIRRLDYVEPEGEKLYEAVRARVPRVEELPLVVLGDNASHGEAGRRLADYLIPFGDRFVLEMGNGWDPSAEICDNGVDDTGDGAVDCEAPGCESALLCRDEEPRRVELFIMSQCPFGVRMLPPARDLVTHFDGQGKGPIDLVVRFIGGVEDGRLSSMHGPSEVAEDLRMACVQDMYPKNHRYLEYMTCRARDFRSPNWQACLSKGMNEKALQRCAEGKKGRALLEESFALSEALGVRASPTLLINGKYEASARGAADLRDAFCRHNEKTKGCDREIARESEPPPLQEGDQCR